MKSRKQVRKKARLEKKQRRALHYEKKRKTNNDKDNDLLENNMKKSKNNLKKSKNNLKKKVKMVKKDETTRKIRASNKSKKTTKQELIKLERDEKEVKKYEKLLKLNKRRKKGTLPKSFHDDGLGYVLDLVDHTNIYDDEEDANQFWEQHKKLKKNNADENEDQTEVSDEEMEQSADESDFSEEDNDMAEDSEVDNEKDLDENQESDESKDSDNDDDSLQNEVNDDGTKIKKNIKKKGKIWEDIYGRLRDKQGNIIEESKSKSIADQLKESLKSREVNPQILRQVRGNLNRLSETNIPVICSQIKEMFKQNSKHDINEAIWSCANHLFIYLPCIAPVKLASEFSILIAILHSQVSEDVGGFAIHTLVHKFNEQCLKSEQSSESKQFDNIIMLIVNLYACRLIQANLIYDLIDKLCDKFNEKCIELIMFILKSVGFILRKDNSVLMKELILNIQRISSQVDKNSLSGKRIGYMLDALGAIKNNNISKLSGYGTGVQLELIENTLKNVLKHKITPLQGRFDEVLQNPRWWIQANIMTTSINRDFKNKLENDGMNINEKLCRKLRLNTPLRKALFIALSTCQDYVDATQKMIKMSKKQFSEVINVTLHVALHEHNCNKFYVHLFEYLSKCDRKYKVKVFL